MARSRNIKPSFFDNDELADNEPLGRLLFIGLWTIADFNGNLEWRERKIKKQILAYDNCDIKKLAINLDKSGFIRYYSDGDKIYINICNFTKHQNPHKNEREKGSDIPDYSEELRQLIDLKELTINHDKSRLDQECSASYPADSCSLNPETNNPKSEQKKKVSQKLDYSSWPNEPNNDLLKEWKQLRTKLKAPVSQTVINRMGKELVIANSMGFTVDKCLEHIIYKGWRGFEAEWLKTTDQKQQESSPKVKYMSIPE